MPIGEPCSAEPCPGRLSVRDGKLPNGCGSSRFPGYGRFVPGGLLTKGPEVCRILSCWVVSSEEERFLDAEEVTGSSPVPPTIIEEKRVPVLPEPFFYGITFVKIKFRVEETT